MDLANLDNSATQEEGAELDVKHPVTLEPIGLRIRVASSGSKRVRKVFNRIQNERMKNNRKRITAEEIDRGVREITIAAVVSWTFNEGVTFNNEVPDCTKENVEKVFSSLPFVREQVDEFAGDLANYVAA